MHSKKVIQTNLFLITILLVFVIFSQSACVSKKQTTVDKHVSKKETKNKNNDQFYYTFLEANRQKMLGDYKTALALFYQCVDLNPSSAASLHEIAQLSATLNSYETAVKYAKMAVQKDSQNKWYYYTLAELYIGMQKYDNAAETYQEIRKLEPENHEVTYYLAMLYKQTGKYAEALNLFNQLEEKIGINESVSINKQQIYLMQGSKSKAYDEINKLINSFPDEPKYYGILAEMYTRDNLFLKAEEAYKTLFSIDSLSYVGQLSIVDFYRKKMDYDNAFLAIDIVIENENIEFNSKVLLLASLLNSPKEFSLFNERLEKRLYRLKELYNNEKDVFTLLADFSIKKNSYDDAVMYLEHVVENFESNDFIWEQLVSLYSVLGKFNLMYEKSAEALSKFPENANFYLYNGVSALQLNKHEESITVLDKGLKINGLNEEQKINFYMYLGEAYHKINNYTQSDFYFEKVLEKQPNNLTVLNNYGYYLSLREQKLEYAEKISKQTIAAEPENSTYLDTYAWILYKLGRYQDALFFIKKAYDYGGFQSAVIVEHYGDILFKTNDIEAAVKMWDLSKLLGNTNPDLLKKIENKQLYD